MTAAGKTVLTKEYKTMAAIVCVLAVVLWFLTRVSGILLPFVLAFVFAYFLHPAVQSLEKRRLSRGVATSVVLTIFMVFVLSVFVIVLPILQTQVMALVAKVPVLSRMVWDYVQSLIVYTRNSITPDQLSEFSDTVSKSVLGMANSALSGVLRVISGGVVFFNVVSMFLITPIILFYVLRDWEKVEKQVSELVPTKKKEFVSGLWSEINTVLSGFIRGQSLVCLSLGAYYGIGLSLIGLDYGLLVGFLAGILSFIPYVGFLTGFVLSVLLAILMKASLSLWIGLAIVFIIGQILEGYVLTPKLVGDKVGLGPVWVMFAVFAGGALCGFIGVLVAVPVAAVIGVLVRRLLKWYRTTVIYLGTKKEK